MLLKRGVDLRMSDKERALLANNSFKDIVLVNSSHSIAHIIVKNMDGMYFRIRLPKWLKGTSNAYLESYIFCTFSYKINLFESLNKQVENLKKGTYYAAKV